MKGNRTVHLSSGRNIVIKHHHDRPKNMDKFGSYMSEKIRLQQIEFKQANLDLNDPDDSDQKEVRHLALHYGMENEEIILKFQKKGIKITKEFIKSSLS